MCGCTCPCLNKLYRKINNLNVMKMHEKEDEGHQYMPEGVHVGKSGVDTHA